MNQTHSPAKPALFARASLPFWLTAWAIVAWSAAAAWVNPAQYADNLEEFSWSHSLELGYWKHPPLPTWLIALPIRLIGFSVYWTYALAAVAFVGTAYFTWRIAERLFERRVAVFAVLLIGLHIGFSWRAQLYNHNTVLVLLSAATVWATLRALDTGRLLVWAGVGVLAGLAMLSKYQAVVPLVGILIAMQWGGYFQQKGVVRGVAVAGMAALVVFTPHVLWIAAGSGSTIANALHSAEGLGFFRRITGFFAFWVVQVRFHIPIFIAIALLVLFKSDAARNDLGEQDDVNPAAPTGLTQQTRAWLIGLIVWPLVFVSLLVLLGGMRLEAQWGLQTFQFVVLYLAWKLSNALPQNDVKRTLWVVLAAQGVLAGFFAWSIVQPSLGMWRGVRERNFPAQMVAKNMVDHWQSATRCPLVYVVGPSFEAAAVSAYSGQHPAVLEDGDFRKSPWVTPALLTTHGALYLALDAAALPAGVSAGLASSGELILPARENDLQAKRHLFWGIVLPQTPCL